MAKPPISKPSIKTEIRKVDPKTLKRREKNARYMTSEQLDRLTENVKRDGGLTSLPLVHTLPNGDLELISGHHRTLAAIGAGLALIDVMVITSELTEPQIVALQLSHNAINGQDDKSILASLYEALDLSDRKYTGLTDNVLGDLGKVDVSGLALGVIDYQQLRVDFLPDDAEAFAAGIKRLGKVGDKQLRMVALYSDFDRVFDTLIRVKEATNTFNAGMALRLMVDLAIERLDQMEQEDGPTA